MNLKEFTKRLKKEKSFIYSKKIISDLITPVMALLELEKHSKHLCLLESVTGGENKGRHSVIALMPKKIWKYEDNKAYFSENSGKSFKEITEGSKNILSSLKKFVAKYKIDKFGDIPPISSGIYGFMGYDSICLVEDIPNNNPKNLDIADGIYFLPEIVIVFDHIKDEIILNTSFYLEGVNQNKDLEKYISKKMKLFEKVEKIINSLPKKSTSKNQVSKNIKFKSHISKEKYFKMVEKSKQYIKAGDIFQIVPSRRFSSKFELPSTAFYRSLRSINPSPYLFYFKFDNFTLAGSSPEIMVKLEDKKVTIRPIAGTRKRGRDAKEDEKLEADLLADKKELAEHLMLLDLGRNDTSKVCKASTVKVTDEMIVEKYSHVMHIVSNVEGQIKASKNAIDAMYAGFPAGTVSGAPKIRAMEIIDELETERRQFYAGTIGYISANGDMDTAIMLRTALFKDNKIFLQAGGGVVYDSKPEFEYEETENKAKALIKAAENAFKYI